MDTQTAYDIAKIILVLSVSFAILGIAIQIIRLFGQLILSMKDVRIAAGHVTNLVEGVEQDYQALRKKAFSALDSLEKLLSVTDILYMLKKFANFFSRGKNKSKQKSS